VSVIVHEKPWGTHYKLKAYLKESREQFDFITDLTIRGKEALRAMGIPTRTPRVWRSLHTVLPLNFLNARRTKSWRRARLPGWRP
jgi:hypothetical protein